MRLFRQLWTGFVNFILIILPVVLLSQALYLYREPIADQFRNFLGDPIPEVLELAEQLDSTPPTPALLKQLSGHFGRLQGREEFTEDDLEQLRNTVFTVHKSLVGQVGKKTDEPVHRELLTAYEELLESGLFRRIFPRHSQLREELNADWRRVKKSSNLPEQPERDFPLYLEGSDTAADLIFAYSNIYDNPVECRNIYLRECDQIYSTSVAVTAGNLRLFSRAWPVFSEEFAPDLSRFSELLPRLIESTQQLQTAAQKLSVPPWEERSQLQTDYRSFSERFVNNLQELYGKRLAELRPEPADFAGPTARLTKSRLVDLKTVENYLAAEEFGRKLLLTPENLESRTRLTDRLTTTYARITARKRFSPTFKADRAGVNRLAEVILLLPDGPDRISRAEAQLSAAEALYTELKNSVEARDYSSLSGLLANLMETRLSSESGWSWLIMTELFLEEKAERLTNPEWQPEENEAHEPYIQLIKTVGRTASFVLPEQFNEAWVDQTIFTLESRRFRRLRESIIEIFKQDLSRIPEENLIIKLTELAELEELPEPLKTEQETLLKNSTYLELIGRGTARLRGLLEEQIEDPHYTERWESLKRIVGPLQSRRPALLLATTELEMFAEKTAEWNMVLEENELAELIMRNLKQQTAMVYRSLADHLRQAIAEQSIENYGSNNLRPALENLATGISSLQNNLGITIRFNSTGYQNLLVMRHRFQELEEAALELSHGSLFRENRSFQQFARLTEPIAGSPLPTDYDPAGERRFFRRLHGLIKQRAAEIEEQGRQKWLTGWGGRLTSQKILNEWQGFIEPLHRELPDSQLSTEVQRATREINQIITEQGEQP